MSQAGQSKYAPVFSVEGDSLLLRVKVVPNASRTKLAGLLGDRLKLSVSAPPENGKANDAVCQLLAKTFGLPVRQIEVTAGHTQPTKTLRIEGLSLEEALEKLGKVLA